MASMAISNVAASTATTQTASAPKAAATPTETTTQNAAVLKPDTVKLSAAGQAKMMHRQGQSPAVIAAALGTNVTSVDGYLGIKVAAAPAAVATPASTGQSEAAEHSAPAPQSTAPTPTAQPATTQVATVTEPAATASKG